MHKDYILRETESNRTPALPNPVTPVEMRALEQAAIASGAVTGLELMERAGQGAVEAIFHTWPDLAPGPHKAVVLCGPGNNGGDGFVVARALAGRGWQVDVFFLGAADRLPPDARSNHDRWAAIGAVKPLAEMGGALTRAPRPALIIDALFGIGLSRPPEGLGALMQEVTRAVQTFAAMHEGPRVVAIDVPSSLNAATGQLLSAPGQGAFTANLCITFHAPKPGHLTGQGPGACGTLVVTDIDL